MFFTGPSFQVPSIDIGVAHPPVAPTLIGMECETTNSSSTCTVYHDGKHRCERDTSHLGRHRCTCGLNW